MLRQRGYETRSNLRAQQPTASQQSVVLATEAVQFSGREQRRRVASWLHGFARRYASDETVSAEVWLAIRRFVSLAENDIVKVRDFLAADVRADVRQVALHALYEAFRTRVVPRTAPGFGTLQKRVEGLAQKYVDPDWCCSTEARLLAVSAIAACAALESPTSLPLMRFLRLNGRPSVKVRVEKLVSALQKHSGSELLEALRT